MKACRRPLGFAGAWLWPGREGVGLEDMVGRWSHVAHAGHRESSIEGSVNGGSLEQLKNGDAGRYRTTSAESR